MNKSLGVIFHDWEYVDNSAMSLKYESNEVFVWLFYQKFPTSTPDIGKYKHLKKILLP